jgi:hypothetical protein
VLTLERVLKDTDGADVNPFLVAELKAELSHSLPVRERTRARALATQARDLYAQSGVTKRFRDRVRKMDERLALQR